jgi:uncharacterized protein CbrC (UPF0167 family)
MDLPHFRFHPDPLKSGSVVASAKKCLCCKQAGGYIYSGPVYTEHDVENALCPWCIADGKAHTKFDVTFTDYEDIADDILPPLVDEIAQRTPGFSSWQQNRWLSADGEPAAFIEPAGFEEIRTKYRRLEADLMPHIVHEHGISGSAASRLLQSLHRDRGPTAYVFHSAKWDQYLAYIDFA